MFKICLLFEEYIMNLCNGKFVIFGWCVLGFVMEFCDCYVSIDLFVFIECDNILNNR